MQVTVSWQRQGLVESRSACGSRLPDHVLCYGIGGRRCWSPDHTRSETSHSCLRRSSRNPPSASQSHLHWSRSCHEQLWQVEQENPSSRYMVVVICPRDALHDDAKVVALCTHTIRSINTEIRLRIQIHRDQRTWSSRRLAVFIVALQNMPPFRAMRTVGSASAELAVIVAIMAIGAENLSDPMVRPLVVPPLKSSMVGKQAGLRHSATARMHHRMA